MVNNFTQLLHNQGFQHSTGFDSDGTSGGLLVGWRPFFSVSILHHQKHLILLSVTDDSGLTWRLALVYGSPYLIDWSEVLDGIKSILGSQSGPLICNGDFNQVLYQSNRLSGIPSSLSGSTRFHQFLFNLGLSEVASSGLYFTWTNNRQGWDYTFESLDRSCFNGDWTNFRKQPTCPWIWPLTLTSIHQPPGIDLQTVVQVWTVLELLCGMYWHRAQLMVNLLFWVTPLPSCSEFVPCASQPLRLGQGWHW